MRYTHSIQYCKSKPWLPLILQHMHWMRLQHLSQSFQHPYLISNTVRAQIRLGNMCWMLWKTCLFMGLENYKFHTKLYDDHKYKNILWGPTSFESTTYCGTSIIEDDNITRSTWPSGSFNSYCTQSDSIQRTIFIGYHHDGTNAPNTHSTKATFCCCEHQYHRHTC